MAELFSKKPDLLVKLSAASLALSNAAVKLYMYKKDMLDELRRDVEFYEELKQAYIDSAEIDEILAEKFATISISLIVPMTRSEEKVKAGPFNVSYDISTVILDTKSIAYNRKTPLSGRFAGAAF
ncbi:hypothetical protein SAMN05660649_00527 [Desulfotomaculum arcticum]|uniref:Uncharacterized protein n=1 Tax=Desulfotruncus arcticus DSM 17038 TaxID=1121424 RepID=A0A1I2NRQ2_9FIRM|nr:hypothetical protein [Desulfotruncus arcticus]SFG06253.1 hypothetical protein SAMN05660649_00527 [Desulfotomaculum arcticum] [Desulfotruncus arcticus DSM 17038]